MTTSGNERLTEALARADQAIKAIKALKGFRSVHWKTVANELREAADAVEQVAKEAKAWV